MEAGSSKTMESDSVKAMEEDDDSDESSEEDEVTNRAIQEYLNMPSADSVRASIPTITYTPYDQESISILKSALKENKEAEARYTDLEGCFFRALAEVRKRLAAINTELVKKANTKNDSGFSYLRCGKPYFKDKYNFTPPENEDTIMMRQYEMYDFSQVSSVPGWTVKDKNELVNALLELSRDIKRKELRDEINKLLKEENNDNVVEIASLEREIKQLNKKSLMEIALPIDQEYDWEALANLLNRRHTAQEYQALWKLFFHPTINKSNWSKVEHDNLQKISIKYNMQDWDNIAKELNTGRTGYQCFVYYRTNMVDVTSNRKWSSEEIEYLQRVIDYFREGTYIPWGKVATAMDNRTKIQVYNKYTRMMERRKGRFLEEEDIVILNCHEKYGYDFKKITEFLPGRSAVQLRTRFNLLTKFRLSKTWTVDDDKKLIQLMANSDTSNASFSNATVHFPGKDRNHIRSRYTTLLKWMKAHPATDLAMAPRRGARRLLHGYADIDLNEAIANLHRRMEDEVKIKKKKRITLYSSEEDIQVAIMAALANEVIKEESILGAGRFEIIDDTEIAELPNSSNCAKGSRTQNLSKILIFLRSALDEAKFYKSKYAKRFPQLAEKEPVVSHMKVKSYSKKNSVQTILLDVASDVWGNKTMSMPTHVLPPNYATITGCRSHIKHVASQHVINPEDEINLSIMARRNIFTKNALTKMKDRFYSLYLFPILLSNDEPNVHFSEDYVPRLKMQPKYLPDAPAITIPTFYKGMERTKRAPNKPKSSRGRPAKGKNRTTLPKNPLFLK